jgi:Tol biopolymer transport system component
MGPRYFFRAVTAVLLAVCASGCAYVSRASVDAAGNEVAAPSGSPSLSADGRYVAFATEANLGLGGGGMLEVYVRDLRTAVTTRVSVDQNGGAANGASSFPSISSDGRYVAFQSAASDLVPNDGANVDVFVRDMQTSTTTRLSIDENGNDADGASRFPSISADGRYVAFESDASDLVRGDGIPLISDVFVRDVQAGTTVRASVDTGGGDPNDGSFAPSLSADGSRVAFFSRASDLVTGDQNGLPDVYVRDLLHNATTRVSVDSASGEPDAQSRDPAISANGRYVAFTSDASDLVTGSHGTLYVRDLQTASTSAVDLDGNGGTPDGGGSDASISADGRYIAFDSDSTDLVPNDTNGTQDVFVRDTVLGTSTRLSVGTFGTQAAGTSDTPSISTDGRYVAFESAADLLSGDDANDVTDVYVRAVRTPRVADVAPDTVARGTTITLTVTGNGFFPGARAHIAGAAKGATTTSTTVLSETELAVSITVDAGAATGKRTLVVWNPGTGPGVLATGFGFCFGCLTVV